MEQAVYILFLSVLPLIFIFRMVIHWIFDIVAGLIDEFKFKKINF